MGVRSAKGHASTLSCPPPPCSGRVKDPTSREASQHSGSRQRHETRGLTVTIPRGPIEGAFAAGPSDPRPFTTEASNVHMGHIEVVAGRIRRLIPMMMLYEVWTGARLLEENGETMVQQGKKICARRSPMTRAALLSFLVGQNVVALRAQINPLRRKSPPRAISSLPPTPGRNDNETSVNTRMHLAYAI